MYKSFYTLEQAKRYADENGHTFIIAYETHEPYIKNGEKFFRKRSFFVFDSISTFLTNRDKYPYAHEIMVKSNNSFLPLSGRLVFDIDINERHFGSSYVSDTFKEDFETTIVMTLN